MPSTKPVPKMWLSDEEFGLIYGKVPRLNLDLIIKSAEGVIMAKRSIEPNIGHWHLPGGTLYKGELVADAAVRIAKKETGLDTSFKGGLGFMEFPAETRGTLTVHTVSIVVELTIVAGTLKNDENAHEVRYFKQIPEPTIAEHAAFLKAHNIL